MEWPKRWFSVLCLFWVSPRAVIEDEFEDEFE
jgi:hypothetical protein